MLGESSVEKEEEEMTYKNMFENFVGRDKEFNVETMCNGAHGLSLLLEAEYYSTNEATTTTTKRLLFDAGPTPDVWSTNAKRLQLPLSEIDCVALSHYHTDHSGGLLSAVKEIAQARQEATKCRVEVDLHASEIVHRAIQLRDGTVVPIVPPNPTRQELTKLGGIVHLKSDAHLTCDDCFYISGFIPRESEYETGLPNHLTQDKNGNWTKDLEVPDERYLACKIKGRGIMLFSSCSHAGIVNVCRDAKNVFGSQLLGVAGGLHLSGGSQMEDRIEKTVRDLKLLQPNMIVLAGHCTGWKAKRILMKTFEYSFQPLSVGSQYTFKSMMRRKKRKAETTS